MEQFPHSPAMLSWTDFRQRHAVAIWCLLLFLLGLSVRVVLVLQRYPHELVRSEAVNIAISLVTTGRYADPFGPRVGPTAHYPPLHPFLLSILFKLFGDGAMRSLAMAVYGSVASALTFALLPPLAMASGAGLRAGVFGGLAAALLPFNFWAQTAGSMDAPLTALFLVGLCWLMCRIWSVAVFSLSEGAVLGLCAGVGCLSNPTLIPVLLAWFIVAALRYRDRLRKVTGCFAAAAVCLVLVLTPWAIRNQRVLGALIFTRSNFGLELQVSNNDLMGADAERNVRNPEFGRFHPFASEKERAKLGAMGEVAYQSDKLQQATTWIFSHRRRFLELTAERIRLIWLPRMRTPPQTALEWALTITGLAGLVLLIRKRIACAWVFGAALFAYPAVYYVIEVSERYHFPMEPLLFLLSAYACTECLLAVRRILSGQTGTTG